MAVGLGKICGGSDLISEGDERENLKMMEMEEVLDYLYSREYGEEQEIREDRKGGSGASQLTVPHWLTKIKTLFPRNTVEIMERHALEKYQMTELLTDPEVLRRLEPNKELLKTVMQLKHMMKGEVLTLAREVVRKVADELTKKLEQGMRKSFSGRLNRSVSSPVKSIRNIDMGKTIRRNLKNFWRSFRAVGMAFSLPSGAGFERMSPSDTAMALATPQISPVATPAPRRLCWPTCRCRRRWHR